VRKPKAGHGRPLVVRRREGPNLEKAFALIEAAVIATIASEGHVEGL